MFDWGFDERSARCTACVREPAASPGVWRGEPEHVGHAACNGRCDRASAIAPASKCAYRHTPFGLVAVIYRWLLVHDEVDWGHALPRGPLRSPLCIKVGVSGDLSVLIGPFSRRFVCKWGSIHRGSDLSPTETSFMAGKGECRVTVARRHGGIATFGPGSKTRIYISRGKHEQGGLTNV